MGLTMFPAQARCQGESVNILLNDEAGCFVLKKQPDNTILIDLK